jgi:ABC-2 type transport system ATP-binding protein
VLAIETTGLGRRYGKRWALRELSLALPLGHVVGLVGPNGAGKSTFLQLSVGLQRPTQGEISVLGLAPSREAARLLPRIGYVAQETNLFRRFKVGDLLRLGAKLNARWDDEEARRRLSHLGIGVELSVSALSGGMRAQVALALALAKQPELLLLDEPVAALDPLARHEFMQQLMEASAEKGLSVIFSSHVVGELHESCDYLIVLANGAAVLEGDVDEIVAGHQRLVGPVEAVDNARAIQPVLAETIGGRQATLLVRSGKPQFDPRWAREPVDLEEIVLAYLRNAASRGLEEQRAA